MIRRLLCVLLSLAMLLSAVAALAEPAEEAPAAAEETPAPAEEAEEAEATGEEAAVESVLLVTVNGEEIKTDNEDLQYYISYYMNDAYDYGEDLNDPELLKQINRQALDTTIRIVLLKQKAAELGLDQISDEEKAQVEADARAEWAEIVESYMLQAGITDESTEEEKAAAKADAEAALLSMGYDEEAYVQYIVDSELANRPLLRVRDQVAGEIVVTDEEIEAFYLANLVEPSKLQYAEDAARYEFDTYYMGQASYYVPEGYRAVTHILLKVDEDLLNRWKDLSARYEEQQQSAEAAADAEVVAVEEDASAEETAEAEIPTAEGASEEQAADAEVVATEEGASAEQAADADVVSAETPEEPVTAEMVEEARQDILKSVQPTVDEIKAKIASGVSFDQLIQEYGTDPGMMDEATRAEGYLVHQDSILWDPAFADAAMGLEKVGDVSEPVVGQNGVHILYYLKDVTGGPVDLTNELRQEIRTYLEEDRKDTALDEALDQWMSESEIVYTAEGEDWKLTEVVEPADADTVPEAEATPGPDDAAP